MTTYYPDFGDRLVPAYPWRRELVVYNAETGAVVDLTDAVITYELYPEDGIDTIIEPYLVTGTATSAVIYAQEFLDLVGATAEPVVGGRYREDWSVRLSGETIAQQFMCDIYVGRTSLVAPFTISDVIAAYPDILARKPYGQTTWQPQVKAVRSAILARLVASGAAREADIVSAYDLYATWWHATVAACLRAVSGGSPAITALAAEHEAQSEAAWPRAFFVEDDSDGTKRRTGGEIRAAADGAQDVPAVVL